MVVDTERCIGAGLCEMLEPGVFVLDEETVSTVIGEGALERLRAEIVVERCPGAAISATEPRE